MLKKASAALAAAAICTSAHAADLPRRQVTTTEIAIPAFTWTGYYIGGHAGYNFSDTGTIGVVGNNVTTAGNVAAGFRPSSLASHRDGFTGGGQIGFNYQIKNLVFGFEADISAVDANTTTTFISARGDRSDFRQSLDLLTTARGRLGVAFDRLLVYGTGGFAYGYIDQRVDLFQFGSGALQFAGRRATGEAGYAVGGGVEYALPTDSFLNIFSASAVTLRGEYLHYDLGRRNVTSPGINGAPGITTANISGYTSSFATDGNVARAAINFKFGSR